MKILAEVAIVSVLSAVTIVPLVPIAVHDGDTFKGSVRFEPRPGLKLAEDVTVRLDCYNAPELRADGGGMLETRQLVQFLGQPDADYWLKTSWQHEKYGRLLGEPGRGDAGYCSTLHALDGGI